MKRLVQLIAAVVVALFGLLPAASVRAADSPSIYTITTAVGKDVEEFVTFLQDEKLSQEEFNAQFPNKAQSLESKIDDAMSDLAKAQTDSDQKSGISNLISKLSKIQLAIKHSREAYDAKDETAFEAAFTEFDTATDEYNAAIDALSKETTGLTAKETDTLYYALAIGTGVLSAAVFAWAFYKRPQDARPDLKAARRNLAFATLWPLGGALVTLGTYIFSTDGTYLIAWGPIGVGVIIFIKGLVDYIKLKSASGPTFPTATPPAQPPTTPPMSPPSVPPMAPPAAPPATPAV